MSKQGHFLGSNSISLGFWRCSSLSSCMWELIPSPATNKLIYVSEKKKKMKTLK